MMKRILFTLAVCFPLLGGVYGQIFYQDDFSNPSLWNLNSTPVSIAPAQGVNDPAYNPWEINALNFFTPSGPISGNSLKITIQQGTDFDGLGLSAGYSGYDPFNVNERNITDAVALGTNDISTVGRFGITLEFDYQSGGWLGDDYGTVLYSTNGGANWIEVPSGTTVSYSNLNMNNQPLGISGSAPAAPPNATTRNAFSNIDGFSSGTLWHRASLQLPPACDNLTNLRIGFRWRNIDHTANSPDYVGVSFNVDNITLRVDPPVADFNWTPSGICTNQNVIFDPSASTPGGGASITSWIWTFSGGTPATSTAQNPSVTWAASGMDTVTLRVVNNLGDTSLIASQYIFINDCQPVAEFLANPTVCVDSVLTVTDLSANMGGAFAPTTWNWTFTGASPANASTQGPHNISFSAPGQYPVTLAVTNSYGSDDTTITVNVVDCSCGPLSVGGIFWSEDFDGNSGFGSRWVTAPLEQSIGAQGTSANVWYISDQENGNPPGSCGSGGGGNQTLHMGAAIGDLGAAYEIGCDLSCFFCSAFSICIYSNTDKRSFSQDINTTGQTNLTLDFDYIEGGEGLDDNAIVEYSTDGGASWNTLADMPKTIAGGCAPQHIWGSYSTPLPASCENISNLRIGFRWFNDTDGNGVDPSFAVDDVRITAAGGGSPPVYWEGDVSNDWHVAANWSTNAVPTNTDNVLVPDAVTLTSLCPGCVMPEIFSGNAEANDICNYGTITIHDTPTKRTLTVWGALLNEGAITTTSIDPQDDVLFRGTASTYAGTGTNVDVDYQVMSGQTTLLSDLSCRTFKISSDFDWDIYTITVKRNFYRTTGAVTTTNSSTLRMDGPGAGIDTNPAQELGSNISVTIPNFIVDKPSGIVTLSTGAVHSISQRMTIVRGIVDAGTGQITGAADLYMYAGEFRLARTGTTVPQITGNYFLTGGLVRLYGTGAQTLRGPRTYYDLEFMGTGVKSLGGNTEVQNHLYLNQTMGIGNHVSGWGSGYLWVLNPDPLAITYTWGHIYGSLRRNILSSGTYRYHVGSDNSGTLTYYEPVDLQTNGLTGTGFVAVSFNKFPPNPGTVSPALTEFGATFTTMETEGFWNVTPDFQPSGGTFTFTQYPSAGWIFSNISYTQVRQNASGLQWNWNGSTRVTALKRRGYASFSNFGIASSNNPFAEGGIELRAEPTDMGNELTWEALAEIRSGSFIVERSRDGNTFQAIGNRALENDWHFTDPNPAMGKNYYRINVRELNGAYAYSNTVLIENEPGFALSVYPNPFQDNFTLDVSLEQRGRLTVNCFDLQGRSIIQKEFQLDQGSHQLVMDAGKMPKGVYILKVATAKGKVIKKLVRQ